MNIINQKRGQMTMFIIVTIVIVVSIVLYFSVRGQLGIENIPSELKPVFDYYETCIQDETMVALGIIGTQGGYINTPEYLPGSEYAPFSSQFNFLGFPVPYWNYVSANGLVKEQIPSKTTMESEIADYIKENLVDCDFSSYYVQGFEIESKPAEVDVEVSLNRINVKVDSDLIVSKEGSMASKSEHNVEVNSKLGKFYELARKIYQKQKEDAVFENYAIDVLRLYAPVDGVEISCSGKIWKTQEVLDSIKRGLEANMASIKFKGNYYNLNDKKDEYYLVDIGEDVDENINLIYSRNMPTKIEINGEGIDENLMIASPVGTEEGLGIMGFCYAPYHFVYDLSFPVLVQIYEGDELFQFPIVNIIDKNVARERIFSEIETEEEEFDFCEFNTQDVTINLYDVNLERVNANLSYQCFNQRCNLGESQDGVFEGKVPSCLNGELIVKNEKFAEKRETFSSNKDRVFDVILDRVYDVKIDLNVGGKKLDGTAMISFARGDGKSISTILPDSPEIKISEGTYSVTVYVYGNSSITIPASRRTQCQEVPRSGIVGFFGASKEECFDIEIPASKIEYALRGGGKDDVYLLPVQLEEGSLTLEVEEMPAPKSLEDLQYNYASFEAKGVNVK